MPSTCRQSNLQQTGGLDTLIVRQMQQVADPNLLISTRAASERAFSELLRPLVDVGYRLACGMLHDAQAAEDAGQDHERARPAGRGRF